MKIGQRVRTKHGEGVIIGKEQPQSKRWGWVVRIDRPLQEYVDLCRWLKSELCYQRKEVFSIEKKGEEHEK